MNSEFRKKVCEAVSNFDSSFREMGLSQVTYSRAYNLLDKIKLEVNDESINGVAFNLKIRYFYDYFCRELMPGGIVLSEQAQKDFSNISDLANAPELLRDIHSPIGF
ncbi:TPA: hypothetical protein ACGO8I_001659 [Streptococcus suis]|nr:hypothetical protein [Streptococcus suis]HEL9598892.1 hypothetical protein [Streptococcus suis]